MTDTAINLYSVRALEEPIADTVDRVASAGYDGVQFSGSLGPMGEDPKAIAERVDAGGLGVTPPHVGMDDLQNDLDHVLDVYEPFDVGGAVIPSIGQEHFESAGTVDAIAEEVAALADELADHGWDLHYHNHAHEYVDLDGEWAFERFIDRTDIGIELDVGWALVGGDDPAARIRSLGERADLIHMKDMDTSVDRGFAEIGEGDVDMQACADAADEVGSTWLIYEHDDPEDPLSSIDTGADVLNSL